MKKCLVLLLTVLFLCACEAKTDTYSTDAQEDLPSPSPSAEHLHLRIVDGAKTGEELLLAGENRYDVYQLSTEGLSIYLDGKAADASVLEDGMPVDIDCDGILECFPGRPGATALYAYSLGTKENPGGSYYDLCGLYLQVLEDLWNEDTALNENIDFLSVDLSKAPGDLTEGEKSALAWRFGTLHGVEGLTYGYQDLLQEGYLKDSDPGSDGICRWENGVLFYILPEEDDGVYSLPVLHFEACKWRSALAAFIYSDCSAVWPAMGTWSEYNVGSYAIS